MGEEILVGEKKYISSKRLSRDFGYTHDYISRLCREEKIDGKLVGRNWFVYEDSLSAYKKISRENQKNSLSEKYKNIKKIVNDAWDELILTSPNNLQEAEGDRGEETEIEEKIPIKTLDYNTISPKRDNIQLYKTRNSKKEYVYKKRKNARNQYVFFKKTVLKILIIIATLLCLAYLLFNYSPLSLLNFLVEEKIIIENF